MDQFNHLPTYGGNASPTVEQQLRAEGDSSRWSSASPSRALGKDCDPEEDIDHHHKKSVFTKVKEKARKLRYSLSGKKRHGEDENATPSWGYNLEDDEDEDDIDAEYLGAPMYESELAPEDCKEHARQHPRAEPVIAENHVLATCVTHGSKDDEKPIGSSESVAQESLGNGRTAIETAAAESTNPIKEIPENQAANLTVPAKTLTETVTEKLAPVYSTVTDATHAIASKLHILPVTDQSSPSAHSSRATPDTFSSTAALHPAKLDIGSEQIWDKGVSVKEYLMHKFEPGEDERALSQVLSEAMSPKRNPGGAGVVGKMREAVNSMLRAEEPQQSTAVHLPAKSSSNVPIYTSAHKGEEESLERILQAN